MIIVNTETIQGKEILEVLGLVRGSTIRAKHLGKDIAAGLKQIIGGELKGYSQMLSEAREQALQRMVSEAEKMKANAIVNVRFTSSNIMGGASEILVYGTAVKIKD